MKANIQNNKRTGTMVLVLGLLFMSIMLSGCHADAKQNEDMQVSPITSATVVPTEKLASNLFNLTTAKRGEQYGEMTVQEVSIDNSYNTVAFTGDVTISGTYLSEYYGMVGEFITLKVDKESKAKIPNLGDGDNDITLDPVFLENKGILETFGAIDTTGSFVIKISKFVATNYIESFTRTALLKEVIEVKADK